jgi:hypothetical protein
LELRQKSVGPYFWNPFEKKPENHRLSQSSFIPLPGFARIIPLVSKKLQDKVEGGAETWISAQPQSPVSLTSHTG